MEYPNYFSVTPAKVRYDKDLKANEKLLYGEISALSNANGYCNAGNGYFAKLYRVHKKTISDWVTHLKNKGYIEVELVYKDKKIEERRIYIETQIISAKAGIPIHQNTDTLSVETRRPYPSKDGREYYKY